MKNEKLDNLSKILLATGAINYMSASLYTTNSQIRSVIGKDTKPETKASLEELTAITDRKLKGVVERLAFIMNDLGNYINSTDSITPIDGRATAAAFEIVVNGKDNVEE